MASLGSKKGVGKVYFINIRGLFSLDRLESFLSFVFTFFFNKDEGYYLIGFLNFYSRKAVLTDQYDCENVSYKVLKKGDSVFEEGMIADGFYVVKEGEFENTFKKTKDGKVFKKFTEGLTFWFRVLLEGGRKNR